MVLLLERALVYWSLVFDERGGQGNLRGSGHRSVIPYVHGRTVLYCSSLPCLSFIFFPAYLSTPMNRRLPEHFIAQGRALTLRPVARQVAPRWLKPYTVSRVVMARSSK
jgi:hypothetical protein